MRLKAYWYALYYTPIPTIHTVAVNKNGTFRCVETIVLASMQYRTDTVLIMQCSRCDHICGEIVLFERSHVNLHVYFILSVRKDDYKKQRVLFLPSKGPKGSIEVMARLSEQLL